MKSTNKPTPFAGSRIYKKRKHFYTEMPTTSIIDKSQVSFLCPVLGGGDNKQCNGLKTRNQREAEKNRLSF